MIGIIDYGLGNLSSVLNAFNTINCRTEIFDNPKNIKKYANYNSRNPKRSTNVHKWQQSFHLSIAYELHIIYKTNQSGRSAAW